MNDTSTPLIVQPRARWWSALFAPLRWIRRRWGLSLIVVVLLLVGFAVFAASRPAKPQYTTALSVLGDLRQTVEAVGNVTSEKALELQFPTLDIVADVQVQ